MESNLIKQWSSNPKPQPRLGIFGLLLESFRTIKRNRNLPILLVFPLLIWQLTFAQSNLFEPVTLDLALQRAEHPKLFQDFGNNMHQTEYSGALHVICSVLLVKLCMLTVSWIINIVFLVATVCSSSEAYTAKVQSLIDMIMKIKESWIKPIFTSFYMILFTMGFIFLCSLSIGLISNLVIDSWASYLFYGVVFLLIMVFWIDISALWMMSLVVSVLEDVGGLDSIIRARELMKGERVKASLLMVLFGLCYIVVHLMTNTVISQTLEQWSRMVISDVLTTGLLCALKLFLFVVFTIFYHDQKENYEEKACKIIYLPIVVDEV